MSDLIERQAAIDAVKEKVFHNLTDEFYGVMQVLDELPTIEAEPVRCGRWIVDDEFIDCSVCRSEKWSKVPYEPLVRGFKYCPKCGAKMVNEDPSHPFADSVMMGE